MKCHEALFWREIRTIVIHCFKILYIHIHVGKCSFFFSDGEVFSFGKSARGRLGRSDEDTMTPKRVSFPTDEVFEVVSISCSHGNTLVATRRKYSSVVVSSF